MNRTRFARILSLVLLAGLLPVTAAWAQSGGGYDLEWSTADGGGAISTGGEYALGGAAGQPDAGTLSGGVYELSGGFWYIKTQYPNAARIGAFLAQTPAWTGLAAAAALALCIYFIRRRRQPVVAA
ncbi:MAG: hypothetical protein JXR84_14500 [Anaerolineae bacterium]|nr:hypothetical protein [Anaerolineae bacterium]